jgi:hypothetical protein
VKRVSETTWEVCSLSAPGSFRYTGSGGGGWSGGCQPSRVITKQTASPLVIRGAGQLCTGAAVKYNLSLIYPLSPPHLEK